MFLHSHSIVIQRPSSHDCMTLSRHDSLLHLCCKTTMPISFLHFLDRNIKKIKIKKECVLNGPNFC